MKAKIGRIKWLDGEGKTKAFLDVLIEDTMTVKGFKIMDGQNGRWLAIPSTKGKDKDGTEKWFPSVTFASKEIQQGFQDHILSLADKDRGRDATEADWNGNQGNGGEPPRQDGFEDADRHLQGSGTDNLKPEISKCKSCGAPIVWMKTEKGKNIPVDADTVPVGAKVYDRNTMETHFLTCPNADEHRS